MALNSEICLLLPPVPGLKACATMPGPLRYLWPPQFYVLRTVHPLQPNNRGPQSLAFCLCSLSLILPSVFISGLVEPNSFLPQPQRVSSTRHCVQLRWKCCLLQSLHTLVCVLTPDLVTYKREWVWVEVLTETHSRP